MKRLRILLLNTYDMNKVLELYEKGLYPSHHLYGTVELAKNHHIEVIIPRHEKFRVLNWIGNLLDIGFLDQQVRAILESRKYDILYAPYAASNTKLLAILKLVGLFRKPLLILVHHPLFGKPSRYGLMRFIVKKLIQQYDTIIFCSEKMRTEVTAAYNFGHEYTTKHFFSSQMGVDLRYYEKFLSKSSFQSKNFIVSAGNTSRDFTMLVQACEKISFPLKIYCSHKSFPNWPIPSHITIYSGEYPFEKICADYNNAQFVLIPLSNSPSGMFGMTSLLDALAMRKPVIMTRNENIDLDFEKENIGISITDNSPGAWVNAITKLLNNFSALERMSADSLRLSKQFDIVIFAEGLAKALLVTYQRNKQKAKKM